MGKRDSDEEHDASKLMIIIIITIIIIMCTLMCCFSQSEHTAHYKKAKIQYKPTERQKGNKNNTAHARTHAHTHIHAHTHTHTHTMCVLPNVKQHGEHELFSNSEALEELFSLSRCLPVV